MVFRERQVDSNVPVGREGQGRLAGAVIGNSAGGDGVTRVGEDRRETVGTVR